MVLIFASLNDPSTHALIHWLNYFDIQFVYVNEYNKITKFNYHLNSGEFEIETKEGKTNSNNTSFVILRFKNLFLSEELTNINDKLTKDYHEKEYQKLNEHFFNMIVRKFPCFGDSIRINKLEVLHFAQAVGLNIPDTYITTNWCENLPTKLITKAISESLNISSGKMQLLSYTSRIGKKDIIDSRHFFPTLFQKEISKHYEIRSFYFNEKFYSIAIFSQNNKKTQIDYRDYDYSKPNRFNSYILPKSIQIKLKKLFQLINLTTGSIDLIYSMYL